jgi:hypothetical protein
VGVIWISWLFLLFASLSMLDSDRYRYKENNQSKKNEKLKKIENCEEIKSDCALRDDGEGKDGGGGAVGIFVLVLFPVFLLLRWGTFRTLPPLSSSLSFHSNSGAVGELFGRYNHRETDEIIFEVFYFLIC